MDLKVLETFVCVTSLKSFRRAAAKLNTTQPAVSQRIAQLERALSVKLLYRDRRSVMPTPQGRELLDYAQRILLLRDELILAVGGASALSGVLRLGTSETLVYTWLPGLLREANRSLPRLTLEIEVDISQRLLERISGFEIDLAFMVGPLAVPQIETRPISRYPVAFVASPELGLYGKPLTVESLAQFPIVTFPRRTQPFHDVEKIFRQNNSPPVRLHTSASLATAVRMALDGLAVAAIPPAIIRPQLEKGELRIVDVEANLPDLQFVAAWHQTKASSAVSTLVAKALRIAV